MSAQQASEGARAGKIQPRGPRLPRPRIAPAKKEDWTDEQRAFLEPLARDGKVYNVFSTLANHPDLARHWITFATYILRDNTLPARDRELLILRIGWQCQAEYEWAQHVRIGLRAGLTEEDIERISAGPGAPGLAEHDRLFINAVDQLHQDAMIDDKTWQALSHHYSPRQMMDLVFTVGQYNLVSMALNSFGVPLDEGLEGFKK